MIDFGFTTTSILAVLIVYYVFIWLRNQRKKCFEAFEGTGIPGPPIRSLINGNADEFWNPSQIESLGRWLNEYGDVFGFYIGDVPFMVIKDVDMIKDICANNFQVYSGRGHLNHIHELHPLLDRNLVYVKGAHWKAARSCMAQFFTTAKLKTVMPSVHDAMRQLLEIFGEHADKGIEVDITTRCERFTFDVISKAAFSIDTGVQRDPGHPLFQACLATFPNFMKGFFYRLGQNLYHWPWVIKASQKLIDVIYHNPLAASTLESMKIMTFRYENPHVKMSDMAQLLLDDAIGKKEGAPKEEETKEQTRAPLPREKMIEVATNAMDIFLGGYDTSRLALTYWFYLMGKHPDVQEKMRQEILDAYKNEGEFLSIPTLQSLQYTNQVINETLRMYPPVVTFTTRRADADHRCGKYLIKKGTSIMIPTYALHHDPQFWTDPETFDPERFSPENKHLIHPVAYQPFGFGIRRCIGMRLALLELASVTSQTLRRYRIELGSNQKRDLELFTYSFLAAPKEKVWIRLHRFNGVK